MRRKARSTPRWSLELLGVIVERDGLPQTIFRD